MKIKSIIWAIFFVAIALPCTAKKEKKVEDDKEDVHVEPQNNKITDNTT